MTIMYIHGYGSNGNATKGQLLRKMMPEHNVVSPTLDYDTLSPREVQEKIDKAAKENNVHMIVGSSFGGYHTLCATAFFDGPVWALNPVHDIIPTINRVILRNNLLKSEQEKFISAYKTFDQEVFQKMAKLNQSGNWPVQKRLHFALSTDDELLGDHRPLLNLFPNHAKTIWKGNSGHRFLRFEELQSDIEASLQTATEK